MFDNSVLSNSVIEIDLNFIMEEVEEIVSKYINIEDLNLCFFAPTKRYPLDKATLHLFNKKVISNKPYLPILCSGIVIDIIKYSIYRSNSLKTHFFNNVLIPDVKDNIMLSEIEKDDCSILSESYIERYCPDRKIYKIADREFKSIEDIINYHIDNTVKWQREGVLLNLDREFRNKHLDKILDKRKNLFKQYNLKFLEEYDDKKMGISDMLQNNDLDNLYNKLNKILNSIDNLNLPSDRIVEIDDESAIHKIYIREHILERRYSEAGLI